MIGSDRRRAARHPGITAHVDGRAPGHVILLNPGAGPLGRPLPATAPADPDKRWSVAGRPDRAGGRVPPISRT